MKTLYIYIVSIIFSLIVSGIAEAQTPPDWNWGKAIKGGSDVYANGIEYSDGKVFVTGFTRSNIVFEGDTIETGSWDDAFVACYDTLGNLLWKRSDGDPDEDVESSHIVSDGSGNIYISGTFESGIDFGDTTVSGSYDNFVAKFDLSGNFQWVRTQDSKNGHKLGDGLHADRSGIYVTTYNEVVKYDLDGNELIRGEFPNPVSVTTDDNANIYLTAMIDEYDDTLVVQTDTLYGENDDDIIFGKLNSSGDLQWVRHLRGEDNDMAYSVKADPQGNIYLGGKMMGQVIVSNGDTVSASVAQPDVFLGKFTNSGETIWAKNLEGGFNTDAVYSMDFDSEGNLYLAGEDNFETVVHKTDTSGSIIWSKHVYDGNEFRSLSVAGNDDIYFAGKFQGFQETIILGADTLSTYNNDDAFIAKLSEDFTVSSGQIRGGSDKIEIKVYPNPADERVRINLNGFSDQKVNIQLYSVQGEKMVSQKIINDSKRAYFVMDISKLTPGLYFLEAAGQNYSAEKRLIIR